MGVTNFSIFSKFLAKDGVSPVFSQMTKSSSRFVNNVQLKMKEAKSAIAGFKKTALGVSAAITAVGTATAVPYKAFSDWEKGINNIYGLMSQSEISQFGNKIKKLSKDAIAMGISTEDANEALFNTISAMGASQKSFDTYNQALILAKAGNADLATSISGLTSLINAWGEENVSAENAANAMFTAQKFGVTTVQELAQNVGSIAPTARAAGVSMEETLATMAALTKGGKSTADATTSLTAVLAAFIKPTDKAKEVLQKYGIASDLVELRQQGLGTTMLKLIKLQKQHPEEIAKAIPKVKALTGVLAMNEKRMRDVDKILNQVQEDIKNGTGLQEAFERMNSGSAAKWARMVGEFRAQLIELGEVVAPYINPLLDSLTEFAPVFVKRITPAVSIAARTISKVVKTISDFINGINDFISKHSLLIFSITAGIGGMLALKTAFTITKGAVKSYNTAIFIAGSNGVQAVSGFKKLQFVLGGYTKALWSSTKAIYAQAKALALNPWTWLAVGIAAVVAGVFLLWKNWDTVTEKVKKFGSTAKSVIHNFWEKCKSVFSSIGTFIEEHFINKLLSALEPVRILIDFIRNLPQMLKMLRTKGDALEIKTKDEGKNPQKTPQIQGGNNKGQIEVKTTIDNNTGFSANTNTSLKSPSSMRLRPAF